MGGKTSTSTQSVSIPPEVMARYNAVNARAEQVAATPFQAYPGQFVAGLTPTQQAGIQATSAASQSAQPYYGMGAGLTLAGAQDVGPLTRGQIGYYESPYTEAVAYPTYQALRQQQGQELAQQQATAIRSGAAFGDRSGLERANLMRQQALGTAQAMAPIYQQGYGQAIQTAQQQQGVVAQDLARRMQAGQQIAGLGTGAQQAALQGAQAQLAAGTAEQQTQQADLTARYQQFLQERGYPFQVAQFLANIAMGTGALSGSTTTTTQPAGFFSDRRLKHDVERIGQTDDGLPIYSYKYNGDDKTQIGLMAQDVEKEKPEAVGLAPAADGNLYKTVDYEKATRPKRDAGGLVIDGDYTADDAQSMGGAVGLGSAMEAFARGGYAVGGGGGLLGSTELQEILKSQQQFLNPYAQNAPYGQSGKTPGGQGYVPQASLPTPKLVTASSSGLRSQPSGAQQALEIGKGLASTYQTGKDIKKGFGEVSDFLKDKFTTPEAANGGLMVPRSAYEEGGDVTPGMPDEDDTRMSGNEVNPAGVPKSGFAEGVLESGKRANELAVAKGGPGGGGGGGLASGIKDAAALIGAGKTLWSAGTAAAEAAPAFFAMFSDERLKDNIRPVGETYDGQNIYAYDMGDGKTQLGLMAQEVMQRKPEAVGMNDEGYLMLNYDRATEDANPFAYGGLVPRGAYQDGGPPQQEEDPSLGLIRRREGFREQPYWDVNAHRVGYGSDTMTTPEGNVLRVTPDMRVSREDAERDLARRVGEFQGTARTAIGDEAWGSLSPNAKAAITSLTYNYGRVPESVARAAQSGDMRALGAAVNALGVHNKGINAGRRAEEASLIDPEGKYQPPGLVTGDTGGPRRPGVIPTGQAGIYAGTPSEKASLGDVVREYAPKGMPTSERFWVPALGFLGSMLASKSPFLGQAIGEGLVGGVGAYTALNKQEADIAKTYAEAQRDVATAGLIGAQEKVQTATLFPFEFQRGYGWVVVDRSDPANPKLLQVYEQSGKPITDPNLSQEQVRSQTGRIGEAVPGAAPSALPKPGDFSTAKVTPREVSESALPVERPIPGTRNVVTAIPEDYTPVDQSALSRELKERPDFGAKEFAKVQEQEALASAATKSLMQLDAMKREFNNIPPGTLLTGTKYAPQVLEALKTIKGVANVFGGDFSADLSSAVASAEWLSKEQFKLGAELQRGLGREPGFILQQMVNANPGANNTAVGFARIASGMEQAALYEKDKAEFKNNYYIKFGHLRDADKLFARLNPIQGYVDRAVYHAIPEADREKLTSYVAANRERYPDAVNRLMQQFDKTYGKGSAKIVMGGQ